MNQRCKQIQDALLDKAYGTVTDITIVNVTEHLRDCAECQAYANALTAVHHTLPIPDQDVSSLTSIEGMSPDWARLANTLERGMQLRKAHEHRAVALFALVAASILTLAWAPFLLWRPEVLVYMQVIGFSGMGLFFLPIYVLRERRGDDA